MINPRTHFAMCKENNDQIIACGGSNLATCETFEFGSTNGWRNGQITLKTKRWGHNMWSSLNGMAVMGGMNSDNSETAELITAGAVNNDIPLKYPTM